MIRIVTSVRRSPVTSTCSLGSVPAVIDGKLVSVEVSGKDLTLFAEATELPLRSVDGTGLTWHGRHAGRVLRTLRGLVVP